MELYDLICDVTENNDIVKTFLVSTLNYFFSGEYLEKKSKLFDIFIAFSLVFGFTPHHGIFEKNHGPSCENRDNFPVTSRLIAIIALYV